MTRTSAPSVYSDPWTNRRVSSVASSPRGTDPGYGQKGALFGRWGDDEAHRGEGAGDEEVDHGVVGPAHPVADPGGHGKKVVGRADAVESSQGDGVDHDAGPVTRASYQQHPGWERDHKGGEVQPAPELGHSLCSAQPEGRRHAVRPRYSLSQDDRASPTG